MASSVLACGLHMPVKISLVSCLRKLDSVIHRCHATRSAAAKIPALNRNERVQAPRKDHKSFNSLQAERQEQAKRSVLISCPPGVSTQTIKSYLEQYGPINNFFKSSNSDAFVVVEYASGNGVSSLLESIHVTDVSQRCLLTSRSRMLFLKNLVFDSIPTPINRAQPKTGVKNDLKDQLSKETSMDKQMLLLTQGQQLTEEDTRLRFLVCSLLQDFAAALFPKCTVRPFGSSVNGFGKPDCDLDMFLDCGGGANKVQKKVMKPHRSGLSLHHVTKSASSEHGDNIMALTTIATFLDMYGPGYGRMQKILRARVPLVRFVHEPSGLLCDLTASNSIGIKSTEMFYIYSTLDPRVKPLVCVVRYWASVNGITSKVSGAWITNFSLTIMVLFFLQKSNPPIIPTVDHLQELAGPADKCVIGENDCSLVGDISRIRLQSNTETLGSLLCEFFDFYATFPFDKMSINIRTGKEQNKPDVNPLHIQNPFEASMNVSRNVNSKNLNQFVASCQEASRVLQQNPTSLTGTHTGLGSILWPSYIQKTQKKVWSVNRVNLGNLLKGLKKKEEVVKDA